VTVEESEYERKPASYSELENTFSEHSDGISGEAVDTTEATKPEASASSNESQKLVQVLTNLL
jgi:hypothetical protein